MMGNDKNYTKEMQTFEIRFILDFQQPHKN